MNDLIGRSKNIFNKLNIEELQKAGIEREDIKVSSHSHHIVTYPPLSALPEINPSEIYSSNNQKSNREIALYLHLPFCTGKCLYCAYITLANKPKEFIDRYIDGVEKEIDLLLKFPNLQNITVNSLYVGGGTPTFLSAQQLGRVLKLLKTRFTVKSWAEITVEAGPETIVAYDGKEKLEILLQNGVNRLSIGFQTFNDDILKLIRRRHNSKQEIEAYNLLEKVGFENINIDLIPGLPDQTLESWQNDLEQISKLDPASVTCYPLSIKQTAAIWPMYQEEIKRFPSRENVIVMHIMANEFFNDLGYTQRPVWWYTKTPEYVYKQQIHKWGELGEQLALGASGYSFMNGFQYFNYRTVPQYLEAVENNKLPVWKGTKLSKEDLMRRLILFGLKTGLSKKLFKAKFDINPKEVFKESWKKLEDLKLTEEDKEIIELSYKGKLFADEISKKFYSDEVNKLIED
ncbi:MAG: coproporphyrinogen-III oxidase family protein [Candidatus Diapherotrites archaeon]